METDFVKSDKDIVAAALGVEEGQLPNGVDVAQKARLQQLVEITNDKLTREMGGINRNRLRLRDIVNQLLCQIRNARRLVWVKRVMSAATKNWTMG